ncbi:MAG: hypothetical protein CSA34_00120 [Desulfobulbus propionicus]|nr:MAG: hypothetical protein CSA34_00120 [Desulfobulbus propionicus]
MSSEEIRFLSYEEAQRIVAAIQEEEDPHEPDHRILMVYTHEDKEICWFDFDEVMGELGISKAGEDDRAKVTEYILHRIPDWALDS